MDATLAHDDGTLLLPDGRRVAMGRMSPRARPLIEAAMLRLSPESSRQRFFTIRYRLSEREIDELTGPEVPGRLAIGASVRHPDGRVEGVGAARYVRDAIDTDAAEIALLVVDDYQKLGIGARLLRRLGREAFQRGIRRLTGLVLADNAPMLALLARVRGRIRHRDGEHFAVEIPLPMLG